MRRRVQVAVVLLLILMVGGLGVTGVGRVRQAASTMQCSNNLKTFAIALLNYESVFGHYPTGTVLNANLPPDQRLSWLVEVWPTWMESTPRTQFDKTKAWDANENRAPYWFVPQDKHDPDSQAYREVIGEVRYFLCPANPARNDPLLPCRTHYVGVAGIGKDAASLPLSDSRAGVFGYDRKTSLRDIKDGHSTTMMMVEALDGGPWTAGGRATVRGLEADVPYLGEGGQFSSLHRGGSFAWSPPISTNVLFVDGSVRALTTSVSSEVFEALATIAGGEVIGPNQGW